MLLKLETQRHNPLDAARQDYESACDDYERALDKFCALDSDSVQKYHAARERRELARCRYLKAVRGE